MIFAKNQITTLIKLKYFQCNFLVRNRKYKTFVVYIRQKNCYSPHDKLFLCFN